MRNIANLIGNLFTLAITVILGSSAPSVWMSKRDNLLSFQPKLQLFCLGWKGWPRSELMPITNMRYNSLLWMCTLNPGLIDVSCIITQETDKVSKAFENIIRNLALIKIHIFQKLHKVDFEVKNTLKYDFFIHRNTDNYKYKNLTNHTCINKNNKNLYTLT